MDMSRLKKLKPRLIAGGIPASGNGLIQIVPICGGAKLPGSGGGGEPPIDESWHQTAELNAEIKGVSSGSNGDLEAAKAAIWEHGYNNFAGNVPSDYINWTGTKSLHFYVILPRKTFVKSFWICAYNQYSINTVSYKSWSETDNEDTTSDNREYFLKISASDEFKSSATVNAEVKRLDVYINMSGSGKFNLYGFRVET